MLLKTADDKSADISELEALSCRRDLDARQRRAIEDELWAVRLGAKAEAEAAYQLDFELADNKHWAVIHDLRIEFDGHVAQIDHIVISRVLEVFVCESKSYTGGVKVNELGEWSTYRGRRPVGIPSPVEQNGRHIEVLDKVGKRGDVELPRRIVAIKPTFKNIVLVSSNGLITRPKKPIPDLGAVVKVDQFRNYVLNRDVPETRLLKIVSSVTLEALGRQLVALHRPAQIDWAARFGIPGSGKSVRAGSAGRRLQLKYDGRCANCGMTLAHGTDAIWFPEDRRVLCLDCGAA
jgi:nuclease-like protein